jgi:hypothetical protein
MEVITTVVAVVLGAHAVIKLAFFALPYARRRAALDRQYAGRRTATAVSDVVLLVIAVIVAVLMLLGGRGGVGFLGGLWVGATLIQVYFHQFHEPLDDRTAPAEPTSPIKIMSYAIQAQPWLAWREMGVFAALVVAGVIAIAMQ